MARISKRVSPYTQVSNLILRDNRISFKAKGLFSYMFSMEEGWNFTIKSIVAQQKDGQASIVSALDELKKFGYLKYEKHPDGSGTYHLDDMPNVENPNVGFPKLGKSTRIKKEQLTKNNNSKKEKVKKENSPSKKSKSHNPKEVPTPLPEWLDKEAWDEWVQHRKEIKKPMTPLAIQKLFKILEANKQHQREMIDTSIACGYVGLFPPKPKSHTQGRVRDKKRTQEAIDAYFDGKKETNSNEIIAEVCNERDY